MDPMPPKQHGWWDSRWVYWLTRVIVVLAVVGLAWLLIVVL